MPSGTQHLLIDLRLDISRRCSAARGLFGVKYCVGDWVFLDSSVDLTTEQRAQVEQITRLALIVVDEAEWTISDVSKTSVQRNLAKHGRFCPTSIGFLDDPGHPIGRTDAEARHQ